MSKHRSPFSHIPISILQFIRRYVPWGIIDAMIIAFSLLLAWSARSITADLDIRLALVFGLVAIDVCCAVNHIFSLYQRMWRYASAGEIVVIAAAVATSTALLIQQGFAALEFFGAFPTAATSLKQKIVSLIRRVATALDLVPGTLKGRELLKRVFYGRLTPLKPEIEDGMAELEPLVPIPSGFPNTEYKILYAIGYAS